MADMQLSKACLNRALVGKEYHPIGGNLVDVREGQKEDLGKQQILDQFQVGRHVCRQVQNRAGLACEALLLVGWEGLAPPVNEAFSVTDVKNGKKMLDVEVSNDFGMSWSLYREETQHYG